MKSFNLALVVVMLAVAPACGGDDQNGSDGGNGNDTGSDSPSANDSGGNDSGTDGSAVQKANYGSVIFSHTQTKTGQTTSDAYTAIAGFFATPDGGAGGGGGCAGTQSGSCCFVPPSQADGGTTGSATAVSAGGITAKDGSATIATLTPTGTSYAPVADPPTSSLTWNAGDMISVTAAGDTVHAFNGSVAAVALFAGVTPALSPLQQTVIPRSSDFTLTWTAGTGAITVTVSALKVASSEGVITCSASSDTGTMVVPHDLLQNFSAGDTGYVTLGRTISADASSDNATVTLETGTSMGGSAAFQ
ncbi:MAG TPA: hypothetical protein VGH28_10650 [Polyangiaceae bacterium]